ncbi:unnamed protein product [Calypogeia fissa]
MVTNVERRWWMGCGHMCHHRGQLTQPAQQGVIRGEEARHMYRASTRLELQPSDGPGANKALRNGDMFATGYKMEMHQSEDERKRQQKIPKPRVHTQPVRPHPDEQSPAERMQARELAQL